MNELTLTLILLKLSSCIAIYGDEKQCMHHHDLTIVLLYYSDCRSWFAVWDVSGGAAGAFGAPERDRTMWAGGQKTAHLSGETTQRAATTRTAGQYRSTQKSCRTCCFTQVTYRSNHTCPCINLVRSKRKIQTLKMFVFSI